MPPGKKPKRSKEQIKADAEAVAADLGEDRKGGPAGTTLELQRRNGDIFRGYLRGMVPESLAAAYQLDVDTIRKIIREQKKGAAGIHNADPVEIINEHVMRLDAAVDELAALAATKGTTTSGRISAVRARTEIMDAKMKILQTVGILPHDLGTIGVRWEMQSILQRMGQILKANGIPESVWEELAEAFAPATGPMAATQPALPAGS